MIDTVALSPDFDPSGAFECRRISYFDHFLGMEEADRCAFIFYRLAIENNSLTQFLVAENKLLGLWARFAVAGDAYGMQDKLFEIRSLHDVLTLGANAIRELGGHPVYFSAFDVIWEPAFDLTHLLWIPRGQCWAKIEKLVHQAGLHFLD